MADRLEHYRRNAAEAERQAKLAQNDYDRASWLRLVRDWLALLPKDAQKVEAKFDDRRAGTNQKDSDSSY